MIAVSRSYGSVFVYVYGMNFATQEKVEEAKDVSWENKYGARGGSNRVKGWERKNYDSSCASPSFLFYRYLFMTLVTLSICRNGPRE